MLKRYVATLRGYMVENIEPLRATVSVLKETNSRVPSETIPQPADYPELRVRERDTLLKIIYGMATAPPYKFDPDARRGDAAAIIASATDAAGCSVSDDTVRKWLKEAAKVAR